MTMLMRTRDPGERISYSFGSRETAGTSPAAATRRALIKQVCKGALVAAVAGGAVAGIIALKVTVYLSRSNY